MPTVMDILAEKGSNIVSIGRDASVLEAATLMNEHKIGCLLVVAGEKIDGIFTERDVLRRVVAVRGDPATMRVEDAMTKEIVCCRPETELEEARAVMKNRRIRHLPVVDDEDRVRGLVSIGDLNAYRLDGQEKTISFLQQYLYGQT